MQSADLEIMTYQACSSLDGRVCQIEIGRRNGRLVLLFAPSLTCYLPGNYEMDKNPGTEKLFRQLSCNLTKIERRTWRKLVIEVKSIAQVAHDEQVSRNAIYERIRGNSKGHGGMIAKNEFVALWWLRRSLEKNENID
jgi:hypothetical protein